MYSRLDTDWRAVNPRATRRVVSRFPDVSRQLDPCARIIPFTLGTTLRLHISLASASAQASHQTGQILQIHRPQHRPTVCQRHELIGRCTVCPA